MRFSNASLRSECKSPITVTNGLSSTGALSLDWTIVTSLVINIQYLLIMDGTQRWLSPTVATRESSIEMTNRQRWYGTRPITACAFSKYARTIKGKRSKLDSLPIGFKSTLVCLMWSNRVLAGMMWLTTSLCQRKILSHGLNSRMDGFGVTFDMEHWWAYNDSCTCSFRWNPGRSPSSSKFWWSTPKYAVYPTFLKKRCTWHGSQLAWIGKKRWLAQRWLPIIFLVAE
jgi:hypothetical protein